MSVKTCKDNLFYPMSGTKIFFNGAWHTIKDLDRIYFRGKWYRINHDIHPLNNSGICTVCKDTFSVGEETITIYANNVSVHSSSPVIVTTNINFIETSQAYTNKSASFSVLGSMDGAVIKGEVTRLSCTGCSILDISNNNKLTSLVCGGFSGISNLDISNNTELTYLSLHDCYLNSESINAVLASLVAHGKLRGFLDIMGNLDPTGQGLIDKQTLIEREWTVVENM